MFKGMALLWSLTVFGCATAPESSPSRPSRIPPGKPLEILCAEVESALKGPESAIDLAYLYLLIGWVAHPEVDVNACLLELDRMARDTGSYCRPLDDPRQKIDGLNRYLFTTLKLSYDEKAEWLHEVIQLRKGQCLSMSVLYIGLALRNGLDLRMVSLPNHSFVRWSDPESHINIETTARGVSQTDDEYQEKHGHVPDEWTAKESLAYLLSSFLAHELEATGRPADALRCCELSLAVHPTTEGLVRMGTALHGLGRYDDSLKSLDRALLPNPHDLRILVNKFKCLIDMGKHDDALTLAQEIVLVHPDSSLAWYLKAHSHYKRKEREKALESFRKARELGLDLSPSFLAEMLKEIEELK